MKMDEIMVMEVRSEIEITEFRVVTMDILLKNMMQAQLEPGEEGLKQLLQGRITEAQRRRGDALAAVALMKMVLGVAGAVRETLHEEEPDEGPEEPHEE